MIVPYTNECNISDFGPHFYIYIHRELGCHLPLRLEMRPGMERIKRARHVHHDNHLVYQWIHHFSVLRGSGRLLRGRLPKEGVNLDVIVSELLLV